MAVYVGEIFPCGRNRNWPFDHAAHLFADSEEELHEFAVKHLGLKRAWFQKHREDFPHYDLTRGKRWKAIQRGANPVDRYDEVNFARRNRGEEPILRPKEQQKNEAKKGKAKKRPRA